MIQVPAKRGHKLQTKWSGPMQVVENKSNLVYIVEDVNNSQRTTVHAQHIVPYPVTMQGEQASKELKHQAANYDEAFHSVDGIEEVRNRRGDYELLFLWLGFEEDDKTWEPLNTMMQDVPGVVEDYLYSAGDRNLERKIIDLYF